MAWYRVGGGGLPNSVKTDMNNVLNKKLGTSTTYPVNDWANEVNLLGALEEKTVSGAIATFADGADNVPLKSLVANLPASLTPYEEVEITHAGKNLLNDSIRGHAGANIYFAHDTGLQTDFAVRLKAGTYTYSVVTADGTVSNLYIKNSDTNTNITGFPAYATLSKTFTIEEDTNCAVYVYKQGYTDVTDIVSAQIEVGSSASDYEPYEEPTTYEVEIPNPNPNLRLTADVDDGMWTTSGTINPSSGGGFGRALTMAVSEKTAYDIYGLLDDLIVYLDSNKTMLSYERLSNTAMSLQNERKTTPANCAYIGLSALAFDVSSVSVKESFLVYGGTADIVNGEGTDSYDKGSMSSTYLSGLNSDYIGYEASTAYFGGHPSVWVRNWNYSRAKARQIGGIGCACNYFPISMHNTNIFSSQYRIYFDVNGKNISSVVDFIAFVQNLEANNESLDIVYELNDTNTTDFAFDPVPIDSKLGDNTIWSDSGDTEVTYRSQGTAYIYPNAEEASF